METCSDGIAVARMSDGRLLEASDAFLRLTGYAREEVIGRTTLEIGLWADADDRARFVDDLRKQGTVSRYPVRFRTKAGEELSVEMSAHVVEIEGEPCIFGLHRQLGE